MNSLRSASVTCCCKTRLPRLRSSKQHAPFLGLQGWGWAHWGRPPPPPHPTPAPRVVVRLGGPTCVVPQLKVLGRWGWLGLSPAAALHPRAPPPQPPAGQLHLVSQRLDPKRVNAETSRPGGLSQEVAFCHFHILLVEASHRASPRLRGGEISPTPQREEGRV